MAFVTPVEDEAGAVVTTESGVSFQATEPVCCAVALFSWVAALGCPCWGWPTLCGRGPGER